MLNRKLSTPYNYFLNKLNVIQRVANIYVIENHAIENHC